MSGISELSAMSSVTALLCSALLFLPHALYMVDAGDIRMATLANADLLFPTYPVSVTHFSSLLPFFFSSILHFPSNYFQHEVH
jgi:hypothetical protein